MKAVLFLQDGNVVEGDFASYNPQELATSANTQGVGAVIIGGMVVNKTVIKMIVSAETLEAPANTDIQLTDNTSIKDYVAEYDSAAIAQQLNEPRSVLIAVGNTVINKNVFKMIVPIPAANQEPAAEQEPAQA